MEPNEEQAYIGMSTPEPEPKPKRKLPKAAKYALFVLLGAALMFGGLLGWYEFQISKANRAMDDEEYEKALEIYESLEDAEGVALANAYITFVEAAEVMSEGRYAEALKTLRPLYDEYPYLWDTTAGEIPDVIAQCEEGIALEEARTLYGNGAYAEAVAAAEALEDDSHFVDEAREVAKNGRVALAQMEIYPAIEVGDFERAVELLTTGYGPKLPNQEELLQEVTRQRVQTAMDAREYERAVELLISDEGAKLDDQSELLAEIARREIQEAMEASDYEKALSILGMKRGKLLKDHDELVTRCHKAIAYGKADNLFNSELYYSAYKAFKDLGDFWDAPERAQKCIIDKPSTGQTYRNSNYAGSACSLKIIPGSQLSTYIFFKIYKLSDGKEIHVSSVFLNPGRSATVNLASGTYVFKAAYGDGDWFGSREMFGDDGRYEKLTNVDGGDSFTLKRNYAYELQLSGASDGNVGSSYESRDSF